MSIAALGFWFSCTFVSIVTRSLWSCGIFDSYRLSLGFRSRMVGFLRPCIFVMRVPQVFRFLRFICLMDNVSFLSYLELQCGFRSLLWFLLFC